MASARTLHTTAQMRYCLALLARPLPEAFLSADPHRASVVYFALSSLDLLSGLHLLPEGLKTAIADWLYAFPLRPVSRAAKEDPKIAAFSFNIAMVYASLASLLMLGDDLSRVDREAVASKIADLQLLPEDGSSALYGAVMASLPSAEADVRYVYSAAAVCAILGLWDHGAAQGSRKQPLDFQAAAKFCLRCQAFDGAFALTPGGEGHGGSTYCATSALALLGHPLGCNKQGILSARLESCRFYCRRPPSLPSPSSVGLASLAAAGTSLLRWLLLRQRDEKLSDEENDPEVIAFLRKGDKAQDGGEQAEDGPVAEAAERMKLAGPGGLTGRPGKPSDVCYTFWVTAALHQSLDASQEDDGEEHKLTCPFKLLPLQRFVLDCQGAFHLTGGGGFGKDFEAYPDPMHSYYAVAGLALLENSDDEAGTADDGTGVAERDDSAAATTKLGLAALDPILAISIRAREHLRAVQEKHGWSASDGGGGSGATR